MTTQQNIFEPGNSGSLNFNNDVKPHKTPRNEPDSLYLELIFRVAKRYGFTPEEMKSRTDSYACLPKHCLAYFLYLDLGLKTAKVAELIYDRTQSHKNISWISEKLFYWLKERSEYRFCYEDIKIIWKEIEEKFLEEKNKQTDEYKELMNILNT